MKTESQTELQENPTVDEARITQAKENYLSYFKGVKQHLIGRDIEVAAIATAICMKEHVLLKGPPGEAKSMVSRLVFGGIESASTFKAQLSRYTSEDLLFGPPDFDMLKAGKVYRNIENSLLTSHFAFLDEVLNASLELICSMNEVLNERTYTRNAQQVKTPLISAIMTTNEKKERDPAYAAFYDRILFNIEVSPLSNDHMEQVLLGAYKKGQPGISLQDVEIVVRNFNPNEIAVPPQFVKDFVATMPNLARCMGRVSLSTRSAQKIITLLKCSAYMNMRKRVSSQDLEMLGLLAEKPEEKDRIDEIFRDIRKKPYFIDDSKIRAVFDKIRSNPSQSTSDKVKMLDKLQVDASKAGFGELSKEIDKFKKTLSGDSLDDFTIGKGK